MILCEASERLAAALAMDPALILEEVVGSADEWQRDVIVRRPARLLLNCTRQGGKSATVAAMAVDEVFNYAPALVLVISPTERQSKETFRTVRHYYRSLDLDRIAEIESESSTELVLRNGSRVVALPGKEETIRGFSKVGLLIIDEAARVLDDLYNSVRPFLAVSGGRLVALSTPFGKRGWWYNAWVGGDDWERVRITAEQCPRITPEFLAAERRSLPESWYKQEYCCEFTDAEGAAFRYEDVMGLVSREVRPFFEMPTPIDTAGEPLRPFFEVAS